MDESIFLTRIDVHDSGGQGEGAARIGVEGRASRPHAGAAALRNAAKRTKWSNEIKWSNEWAGEGKRGGGEGGGLRLLQEQGWSWRA